MYPNSIGENSSYLLQVPHTENLPGALDAQATWLTTDSLKILEALEPDITPDIAETILIAIQRWTQGQPLLTSIIHKYLTKYSSQIIQQEGAGVIDEIVRQKIIKNWDTNEAASYLTPMCQTLLRSHHKDRLLLTYMQVLSRGTLHYQANNTHTGSEQKQLLHAGLLRLQGSQLMVSNHVCASAFDMHWIEQQIPGITRGVSVVRRSPEKIFHNESKHNDSNHNISRWAKRYSKLAIVCGAILSGSVAFSQMREGGLNFVSADMISTTTLNTATAQSTSQETSQIAQTATWKVKSQEGAIAPSIVPDDSTAHNRQRFDQGLTHAVNGRWSAMLQQFCLIPESSVYFTPAVRQLEKWQSLYPQDIRLAKEAVSGELYSSCTTLKSVIKDQ